MSNMNDCVLLAVDDASQLYSEEQEPTYDEELSEACDIKSVYLEELGVSKGYHAEMDDNFYSIAEETHDKNGQRIAMVRVKIAERSNTGEQMILLSEYEKSRYFSSTFRALIHHGNDGSRCLYTSTLGEVSNINFDIERWCTGEEYEWGIELLYQKEA